MTTRRRLRHRGMHLGLWLLVPLLGGCSESPLPVAELTGQTMGTGYSIKLSPAPAPALRTSLAEQVEQRLARINAQMSTYRPDSDLMRFNRSDSLDWQAAPGALVELVERAGRISVLSGGRYDITVGPLVNLWGFGSDGPRASPPDQHEIDALLDDVGYRHLAARRVPPALRKTAAGLQIDLSSIAKGWAVDQLGELLRDNGFDNFLVEIGGEVLARGEKSPGRPWRIAIEQPHFDRRDVQRVITLQDMAMATSGDYRNFFVDAGNLYSHTIDPRSGQAVRHRLTSVTVLADNCTDADAWATALMALGEEQGPRLAAQQGIKALFIVRADDGLVEQLSPALAASGPWGD